MREDGRSPKASGAISMAPPLLSWRVQLRRGEGRGGVFLDVQISGTDASERTVLLVATLHASSSALLPSPPMADIL